MQNLEAFCEFAKLNPKSPQIKPNHLRSAQISPDQPRFVRHLFVFPSGHEPQGSKFHVLLVAMSHKTIFPVVFFPQAASQEVANSLSSWSQCHRKNSCSYCFSPWLRSTRYQTPVLLVTVWQKSILFLMCFTMTTQPKVANFLSFCSHCHRKAQFLIVSQ